jgi:hypothetical protein
MKWLNWWKKTELDDELRSFEWRLDKSLFPIEPRPEFVTNLRKNLLNQNLEIALLPPKPQNQRLQTGILVTGGVLSVLFMVLAGVRGVVSIVGAVGLLISFVKQNTQEIPTPTNFAG